jgi:hypothetical protein
MGSVSVPIKMTAARTSHFSKEGGTVGEAITEFIMSDNMKDLLESLANNSDTRVQDIEIPLI